MRGARGLRALAVVDLGFGDSGKGLLTDHLTRRHGAGVVVRFNGGAQAGHNVVTPDGRHHTFSQLGAGSFVPGVRTFLSRHVVVHPAALLVEAAALASKGVPRPLERVAVSEAALLVTPFHQAANRLRELARGAARHGSVGVGVGEAVEGALRDPDGAPRARDLGAPADLRRKLDAVRERLLVEVGPSPSPGGPVDDRSRAQAWRRELDVLRSPEVAERWLSAVRPVAARVVADDALRAWLPGAGAVVFEGAQGLLLDETLGFHPYTTWSDCTPAGARELLAEAAPGVPLELWGVLRAHGVRHGPGPLPSEDPALAGLVVEHNVSNPWQGAVRYGWFDAVLARYALDLTPGLDVLVLTHVDALVRRSGWRACAGYSLEGEAAAPGLFGRADRAGCVARIRAEPRPALARQAALGAALGRCVPVLADLPPGEDGHLAALEGLLGRRIDVVARGPRATDVGPRYEDAPAG